MEGAGHRRRWDNKAPAGTVLLLMCVFIHSLASMVCPPGDYATEKGICCNKCSPGFKLVEECHAAGQRSNCTPCPLGQYTDQMNYVFTCMSCKRCLASRNEVQVSACQSNQNTICQCKDGYYKSNIDSVSSQCLKCLPCGPNEMVKQACTTERNTVCTCKENYYRVGRKCELCKNCTAECTRYCSTPSSVTTQEPPKPPPSGNAVYIAITVGAFVLAVLVFITHIVTKWFIKKKLLKSSSQPSDVPLQYKPVLIVNEDPLDNSSVKALPQSPVGEQEPPNLPDCVPLEIKVPDLIYTVLDLVPVLQVKQLVRTLGVRDIEIEQAEMDHRSCREAHYQMLRVWTERVLRAGEVGQGEMLHWPLMQELLDQLRKMHLEWAADELETKYGIQ